ncbi:hypothetical protein RY074_25090 [Streptomyces iranensis]|uniref:Uncharacterized protein n=1 Tax=Streptomyces iranensis TaxID=576784 RepID=A0ABS4N4L3_9ACTN|nr:hypothetical protein [Streptomyces iranensis]MBP2066628.1 hypothetical protein [Streptomyces iranensis]
MKAVPARSARWSPSARKLRAYAWAWKVAGPVGRAKYSVTVTG